MIDDSTTPSSSLAHDLYKAQNDSKTKSEGKIVFIFRQLEIENRSLAKMLQEARTTIPFKVLTTVLGGANIFLSNKSIKFILTAWSQLQVFVS
jgi:hypothetical protein